MYVKQATHWRHRMMLLRMMHWPDGMRSARRGRVVRRRDGHRAQPQLRVRAHAAALRRSQRHPNTHHLLKNHLKTAQLFTVTAATVALVYKRETSAPGRQHNRLLFQLTTHSMDVIYYSGWERTRIRSPRINTAAVICSIVGPFTTSLLQRSRKWPSTHQQITQYLHLNAVSTLFS